MLTSAHFTVAEFACDSGDDYPDEWIDSRLQKLCGVLDAIRDQWGGPLVVISGYRSPEYNERLRQRSSGVAKDSQHVQGRAADVAPVPRNRVNVMRLNKVCERLIAAGKLDGLGGIGLYSSWVHIDVRDRTPENHIARWIGSGLGSEPVT